MATAYKVLGQNTPSANTLTTLYTVPSSTSTVVSTLSICNTTTNDTNVDIAICPANVTANTEQYIVKNCLVSQSDSVFLTLGVTLATTDTIRVFATVANVSFNAFGSEVA